MGNIKDILRQLLKDNEEIYSVMGEAISVDNDARTCKVSPLDGSADIFNVRLQTKIASDIGLVLFPKQGSQVTVSFLSKELAFVSKTDEIESLKLDIEGFSLFIDNENFEKTVKNTKIDSESYELTGKNAKFTLDTLFEVISLAQIKLTAQTMLLTGAVTINGATAINGVVTINGGALGGIPTAGSLTSEINALKADINTLKAVFNSWIPSPNDGGFALKAAANGWRGQTLQPTVEATISNPQVKQ